MRERHRPFVCRQCGNCCRVPGHVRLLADEPDALAAALGLSVETFLETRTLLAPDRRALILTNHPDGSCVLLDQQGRCRVHAVKPLQCRTFPFAWVNSDSAAVCPGLADVPTTAPPSVRPEADA